MSHTSYIETSLKNLDLLKRALNNLQIKYKTHRKLDERNDTIIIEQANNSNIKFEWQKNKYCLSTDVSMWQKSFSIEDFLNKVHFDYSREKLIVETNKTGFQTIQEIQNLDKSTTLVFEKWGGFEDENF